MRAEELQQQWGPGDAAPRSTVTFARRRFSVRTPATLPSSTDLTPLLFRQHRVEGDYELCGVGGAHGVGSETAITPKRKQDTRRNEQEW